MRKRTERRSQRFSWLSARLLLLAAGLGIGVAIAEFILAACGLVALSPYEQDRLCGSRLKANYAGWQTTEGQVFVRTNSDGYRDREHRRAKPAGTIRIAVLGDSYCEAMQVELEQTFWSIMQRDIQRCLPEGSPSVEVINTGVAGYGTAQELLTLRHRVWRYDPDVILLCVLPANDIRNNSKTLEPDQNRPFYRLDNDRLVLDTSFLQNPLFASPWVKWKDQLVSRTRLGALAYRWRHRQAAAFDPCEAEPGLDSFIYQPPQEPSQRQAWRITQRLLQEIHREVEQHQATLVVATFASGIQVHPDPSTRRAFADRHGIADLDYADRRTKAIADQLGCIAISLVEPMRRYAESNQRYLHGFENTQLGTGHWNVEGHRVAGEIIAQELCASPSFRELFVK